MFRRHGTSDAFQVHNELTQGMSLPSVFQLFLQLVTVSSKHQEDLISHGVHYYYYHNTQMHTHTQTKISLASIMLVGSLAVHVFPATL
jgi:hypothetical protein